MISIDVDQLLYRLFCAYAFLLPFEFILEFLFQIDTIFKPYRVVSLLIILIFSLHSLRSGLSIRKDIREDIFVYFLLLYGIVISLFRLITEPFNMRYFTNDLFQTSLYILTFFIFKSVELTSAQLLRVLRFFVIGLVINSLYIFYNFFFLGNFFRDSGFMDNPNYLALGLIAALAYYLLRTDYSRLLMRRLAYLVLILFLLYVFTIAGSRTGLVLLVISLLFVFYFISLRMKVLLLVVGFALGVQLLPRLDNQLELGGPLILVNRVMTTLDSELEDVRFVVWRGTFKALETEGYLGMGIGQFKAKFTSLFHDETNKLVLEMLHRDYHLSTHNDILSILTDYGLPGVLCYLTFLVLSLRKLWRRLRRPIDQPQARLQLQLAVILFSCLVIFGLAAENIQNQLFWFLMAFATKTPAEPSE